MTCLSWPSVAEWLWKSHLNSSVFREMDIMLLLLSRFSHVRLCATPKTAAYQAPLSLGFSRQEHWSGFPFPSSMHESEKWKWSRSVVSNPQRPHGLQPTRLLLPWDFPGKSTGVGCHCHIQVYTFVNLAWSQWTYPQAKGEVLDDFMILDVIST